MLYPTFYRFLSNDKIKVGVLAYYLVFTIILFYLSYFIVKSQKMNYYITRMKYGNLKQIKGLFKKHSLTITYEIKNVTIILQYLI